LLKNKIVVYFSKRFCC